MIPTGVHGAGGRMGAHLLRAVRAASELRLTAAIDRDDHPEQGREVAPGITLEADLDAALAEVRITIDFSIPEATLTLVEAAAAKHVSVVIGTTGFDPAGIGRIEAAAKRIPIVLAANFSLATHVLTDLVRQAAARLEGYDIEVLEMHHNQKVDAPSGTALRLGRAAAEARGQSFDEVALYHREGKTGIRPPGAIGMQTLRAGDSVGEHTIYFAGPGERIELAVRALSRDNYAAGAIRAATWLGQREPGFYTMSDVLGS